jgi:hypothetical protein
MKRDAVWLVDKFPRFGRILLSLTPGENIPLRLLVCKDEDNMAFLKAGNYCFVTPPSQPKKFKYPETPL